MKYENFERIQTIVETIGQHQGHLDNLSNQVVIEIKSGGYKVYTIGVENMSEHSYAKIGRKFIQEIKDDLQQRIDKLKKELESL